MCTRIVPVALDLTAPARDARQSRPSTAEGLSLHDNDSRFSRPCKRAQYPNLRKRRYQYDAGDRELGSEFLMPALARTART